MSLASNVAAARPIPLKTGRYELGEVLATGGMGTIRRAFDRLAKHEVAYKHLTVSIESNRARMSALFQREYDTLARLEHPNIVRVYDYGFDASGPYYTMELLSGHDLAKLAPLPFREACRILRDVASALALIHTRRCIHRDVSPNNVRLTADGRATLMDFGALTPFGRPDEVVGTPAFIAPECLTAEPLDQRTDLYSLGALAYWLLTRTVAVRAYGLDELAEELHKPIIPPSQRVAGLPSELDELVMSLLQHDRMQRPSHAAEVIERLQRIAQLSSERAERDVAFSYLLHPPLAGRADVEREIERGLDRLLTGRGEVMVVDGAPGGGRSALLEQVAIRAQLRGATVLRADGAVQEGPLGLVDRMMQTGLLTYPDMAQSYRTRSSLMLDPKQFAAQSSIAVAERHARLAASAEDAFMRLALRGPLVLLVDNASQADKQSMSLLASMAEAIERHPLLLVVSTLSGPPSSDAEAQLRTRGTNISLAPLSADEVGALVQSLFGQVPNLHSLGAWLHDESGGNPALCLDLVRMLIRRGHVLYGAGTFSLPQVLERGLGGRGQHLLLDRLSVLGDDARKLVSVLSLHDGSLGIELLAQAAGLETPATLVALDQLHGQNITVGSNDGYSMASSALRAAVVESLDARDKREFHLSLARAIRVASPLPLFQTYTAGLHLIRAGGAEELEGARLIANATRGRTYEVAMSGDSIRYLEDALEVVGRHGEPDDDFAHLLIPLSVAGFYGDMGVQRRYLDRAMRVLSRAAGLHVTARLTRWIGAKLALILGITYALLRHRFRPSRTNERSVRQNIEAMMNVAAAGSASACCAYDRIEAARIERWLTPFAVSSIPSVRIAREFTVAMGEMVRSELSRANLRLEALLRRVSQPVLGMDERVREQLRLGCLNARADAASELDPVAARVCGEEVERTGSYLASHGVSARMNHHVLRGELDEAEKLRALAETLAFRAGNSWSSLAMIIVRVMHGSVLTDNTIGMVRSVADLERLENLATSMQLFRGVAQACLLRLRGLGREALPLWQTLLEDDEAKQHYYYFAACAWWARALSEQGEQERAKQLCEQTLSSKHLADCSPHPHEPLLRQQLALAEAGLANFYEAIELLDAELASRKPRQNPLELGALHRDRAQVALLAGDRAAFSRHFDAMQTFFRATRNPWLIQQCDTLLTRAVRAGVRPSLAPRELAAIEASDIELDGSTVLGNARVANDTNGLDGVTILEAPPSALPAAKGD